VLVELCGVGSTLADLLRTETEDDIEKVEAAAAAAREHTLAYNAPLRAVLQRAEPRVAASKGKGALSLRLDDRMKTGDCYVNQGLSTAVAAAEKIPGVELYHIEAAKCALRLRMAILAEDAAGIRAALHGISAASGGTLVEHKHGLVEAGRTLEARLAAQSAMLTAMNQRNLARLTSAVAEGENQERAAKLLPFLEKQTMGSLPGVLRDARKVLELLKAEAEMGATAVNDAEIAPGVLASAACEGTAEAEAAAAADSDEASGGSVGETATGEAETVLTDPPPPASVEPIPPEMRAGETELHAVFPGYFGARAQGYVLHLAV